MTDINQPQSGKTGSGAAPQGDPCDEFRVNGEIDVEKELDALITLTECVKEQLGNLWGAIHLTTIGYVESSLNNLRKALDNHRHDKADAIDRGQL